MNEITLQVLITLMAFIQSPDVSPEIKNQVYFPIIQTYMAEIKLDPMEEPKEIEDQPKEVKVPITDKKGKVIGNAVSA